jgi:hypothetical protein
MAYLSCPHTEADVGAGDAEDFAVARIFGLASRWNDLRFGHICFDAGSVCVLLKLSWYA